MAAPPLILPDELGISTDAIYHPVDPARVPEISSVLAWLAQHDPDVLGAVAEVDRGLIWAAVELEPRERLHQALQVGLDLAALSEMVQKAR